MNSNQLKQFRELEAVHASLDPVPKQFLDGIGPASVLGEWQSAYLDSIHVKRFGVRRGEEKTWKAWGRKSVVG